MSDIDKLQKEYEATQAKLTKLAEDLKSAEAEKFKGLPASVGLSSIDALIKALRPYASPLLKGRLNAAFAEKPSTASAVAPKGRKRRRVRLTDEDRKKIVEALKAGGKTAAQLAAEFGVSVPTVTNIKADAGLTKKRK